MGRRKTQEEFEKQVFKLVGDEYSVLGSYMNNYTGISMIHNECKHKWDASPKAFVTMGRRCPRCSSKDNINNIKWMKERKENE